MLRAGNLTVSRGGRALINGLSFSIEPGSITVVLGPNGAGKSTLLLALAGMIESGGELLLEETPLASYARHDLARRIAWQGELPPTEFGLTVQQRLALAASDTQASTRAAAQAMDIDGMLDRPLGELSSGERQRTELAALSLRETAIWLLDEPTAHLDMKHQLRCIAMLKAQRARGRAMVVVLHDLQQAMAVADWLILVDGRGGAEYGAAAALLEETRMSNLFGAPLVKAGDILVPDYGTGDA